MSARHLRTFPDDRHSDEKIGRPACVPCGDPPGLSAAAMSAAGPTLMRRPHHDVTDSQVMSHFMVVRPARAPAPDAASVPPPTGAPSRRRRCTEQHDREQQPRRRKKGRTTLKDLGECPVHHAPAASRLGGNGGPGPRLPEFSRPDYFAFLFNVSIRTLAAGPDEAGFWPVISWPSVTV